MRSTTAAFLVKARLHVPSAVLAVAWLWCCAIHAADEPAPPKPRDWGNLTAGTAVILQVKTPDGSTRDVVFHYCPAGEVVLGDASDDAALAKPMKPFLMMEAELGVGLAHALASPEVWRRITDRVAPLNDPDAKNALANPLANGAIPLTYINLDEAASICDSTTLAGITTTSVPLSPIEAWEIRMPTHAEWQYACRTCADRESARRFPHFSPWPNYEAVPKAVKGDCADQWEGKFGRPAATFTGSQLQVISLMEKYDKGDNPKPGEILGDFLARSWWRDTASRAYTVGSMTGPPRPPDALLPNAWGLRGMCDNACEWVLCVGTPGDVRSFCATIMDGSDTASSSTRAVVFLAGGSSREFIEGKEDWQLFAIGGGQPRREGGAGIDPRTWEAANGDDCLVDEYAAGCRFVADRVLSADWAYRVRSDTRDAADASAVERYFRGCESTINEIIVKEDQGTALRILATFEALARYRIHDAAGTRAMLQKSLAGGRPTKKRRISLADMSGPLGGGGGGSRPPADGPPSEDELFTRALIAVVSAEEAAE